VAHSNQFYGLRIHPEFYSKGGQGDCPCCSGYSLLPAVFSGLIGYKNGVNCIVATQVGCTIELGAGGARIHRTIVRQTRFSTAAC
jgi:hypothetical protein